MYALAASAAGVSFLAVTQSSQAKIIYTKAHYQILQNAPYDLDLNHDGLTDFTLWNHSSVRTSVSTALVNVVLPAGNAVRGHGTFASALPMGVKIQPGKKFLSGVYSAGMAFSVYATFNGTRRGGPWLDVTNRYLGLKFKIKGKPHYGWARLSVSCAKHKCSALLTGYAYETIPGKAIITGATKGPDDPEPAASFTMPTPEPLTLGALAMGTPGLSIWRRKESALQGN
jgi:hypothetical protein